MFAFYIVYEGSRCGITEAELKDATTDKGEWHDDENVWMPRWDDIYEWVEGVNGNLKRLAKKKDAGPRVMVFLWAEDGSGELIDSTSLKDGEDLSERAEFWAEKYGEGRLECVPIPDKEEETEEELDACDRFEIEYEKQLDDHFSNCFDL